MTPYYDHTGITIYHGDCRDILPGLDKVDLVLTDPPYGIGSKWRGGFGSGWKRAQEQSELRNKWDAIKPSNETIISIINHARMTILWGGNYFCKILDTSRCWFVWNKPERGFSLAEAELAWTSFDNVVRVCDCNRSDPGREHPTQKPIKLMLWCISQADKHGENNTILDPFMGSGTTLRAAKDLNRKAIGIEMEEKYCEIAAKRLEQEVLPFG